MQRNTPAEKLVKTLGGKATTIVYRGDSCECIVVGKTPEFTGETIPINPYKCHYLALIRTRTPIDTVYIRVPGSNLSPELLDHFQRTRAVWEELPNDVIQVRRIPFWLMRVDIFGFHNITEEYKAWCSTL